MGFAAESIGRLNRKASGRFTRWPNLGRVFLLFMLGGAACGYSFFLWLDPLAIFGGFFSAWRLPLAWASLALAAGFPLVLILSLVVPQAWCHRLCPLGAAQDGLSQLRRIWRLPPNVPAGPAQHLALSRRGFMGLAVGGALALILRRWGVAAKPPVRPPGARPEDQFTGLCARCGACIRACPYGILQPDVAHGLAGFLAPVVDYSRAHCFEYCHECTQVCPTGAIERLALEAKRNRTMGLAGVDREKCIAWHDRQYCMVCHEFCPYLAIEGVAHNGVNCPVVKPDMCRGCGACQVNCPAQPDKAIVVQARPQQPVRPLTDVAL